ncbi:MAG: 4'-phosphopantetheinyl transferase superfamily protein [Polaromonas sp.]|nr:4'-phosphopantetheinyl transferase superfamily protein [Polaromonas sp.]
MQPALEPVTVHAWPQHQWLAVQALRSAQAMTVISIATPATENRRVARSLVRSALRETLAVLLGQPAASIALVSPLGRVIHVDSTTCPLSLSISHSPGISVAAICQGAAIGIDVMQIEAVTPGHPDWLRLASDYLGPQVTANLQSAPPATFQSVFAQAWTDFEAALKCLGLGLTEWSPELASRLASCRVMALDLPASYCGSIATVAGDSVTQLARRT